MALKSWLTPSHPAQCDRSYSLPGCGRDVAPCPQISIKATVSPWEGQAASIPHSLNLHVVDAKFQEKVASPTHGVEALYQAETTGAPVVLWHPRLLIGWRFNFRRVKPRSSKATAPARTLIINRVVLWAMWALSLILTPEQWLSDFAKEER